MKIVPLGAGHINQTFKVTEDSHCYVLQRINKQVFTKPECVAENIRLVANHLAKNFPDYFFLKPVLSVAGHDLEFDRDNHPWRLMPFVENGVTKEALTTEQEAFEAARGFAGLTRRLSTCSLENMKPTIERFHDLTWRVEQFRESIVEAEQSRLETAAEPIALAKQFSFLADEYRALIDSEDLQLRITHNDTKINNILFDREADKALCVIDLDTLMPGYFIYDLGDLIRTCVSPVSEEERDLSKIVFRKNFYDAVVNGYLTEMGNVLSKEELSAVSFSGLMMTYIMALRFLTDYLKGDVYYSVHYDGQNLNRAKNQFTVLQLLYDEVHHGK
ncbi:MAG: aminoglycoside phosphotransferase family protein [Cyclobacteriaceae bacterium]|nr:aminoglycoside phosphotransferase family protein [Cyclobacteriaceae bacterium]